MKKIIYLLSGIIFFSIQAFSQTRTAGLFINDTAKTYIGYTLFAPKQNTMTYLINNEGCKVHEWTASKYPPGQSVYLLENGDILRTCMTPGNLGTGGGEGGRVEEYNWNDSLIWSLDYSTTTYMQHHDIKRLPNGNIIMLVVEKKTLAEIIATGFDTSKFQEPDFWQKQMMLPDCVVEIHPTLPSGGTVVWEWHVWDHLIQSFDISKSNYGVPSAHPELIDAAGDHKNLPLFWNHMNSIDYNSSLDQIALSVRGNSEVWIIDHSTTTAEAKGHTGGIHSKGGDLLYRWGNPITYGAGTVNNQMYYQQHDVEWVKTGCPGAGDLTCFNNGVGRNYSTIDEITPPVDASGNYSLDSGTAFGPTGLTWTYEATPPTSLYSQDISGAQRLPNGNTLIDEGTLGTFMEVTSAGEVVWKYINPVDKAGVITQGDTIPDDPTHPGEKMNSVFRVYKYAPEYAAFTGRDLSPGDFIEKYPTSADDKINNLPSSFELFQNYPNPFNPSTTIRYSISRQGSVTIKIYNLLGEEILTLVNTNKPAGSYSVKLNSNNLASGIYLYRMESGNYSNTKKFIVLK